ncbi:MAG: AMMECR1 domain-containing protein, partial [Solirubrobacterales bacterium]
MSGLSEEDRRLLLRVAREALAAHFAGRTYRPSAAVGAVGEARGAFVSLHRRDDDDLRGCVGQIESAEPLVETVARMAVAAATHDGRFQAVTREELPELVVEISA